MSASALPPSSNTAAIAGPELIGYFFNIGLYGSLWVQVFIYYVAFPMDRTSVKCLVFGLFAIETVQTAFVMHDAFDCYAAGLGNLDKLNDLQFTWLSVPVMSGIIAFSVQTFFAYRIGVLSGSRTISFFAVGIALTQGCAGIAAGIQAKRIGNFANLQVATHLTTSIWLAGSAVCDIIIAILMTYFLLRKDTGFSSTHALVLRLIRLTVETGTITATVATVDVILFLSLPDRNYYSVPAVALGKLYSNTALAVLNSRMRIHGGRNSILSQNIQGTSAILNIVARPVEDQPKTVASTCPPHASRLSAPLGGISFLDEIIMKKPSLFRTDKAK